MKMALQRSVTPLQLSFKYNLGYNSATKTIRSIESVLLNTVENVFIYSITEQITMHWKKTIADKDILGFLESHLITLYCTNKYNRIISKKKQSISHQMMCYNVLYASLEHFFYLQHITLCCTNIYIRIISKKKQSIAHQIGVL